MAHFVRYSQQLFTTQTNETTIERNYWCNGTISIERVVHNRMCIPRCILAEKKMNVASYTQWGTRVNANVYLIRNETSKVKSISVEMV